MFPPDSHWELHFSNHEKGPKSQENDPPVIRKLATGLIFTYQRRVSLLIQSITMIIPLQTYTHCLSVY